ncbi:MAG: DUF721 domain-containing protein [Actinomycetaceae bacterium]|nr:DUF721 domain-containing protein [Actinomycetaceae bacterium]
MSEAIKRARARAAEKYGDLLPLQALERARYMAEARGWVRRRIDANLEIKAERPEPIGEAPLVVSPGQDVGSGARPSSRDPKLLGTLLNKTIAERGWKTRLDVAQVANRWSEIVGDAVAANCAVVDFSVDGVLTLKARSVAWETQLRALAAHLDQRLAHELGEGVVKEIVIQGPHVPSWKHGRLSVPGRGPRDTYS